MLVEESMIKSKYEINIKILESNKKYLDEALLKKEEIEDEIGDYSLTPKKNIVRQFFPFKAEAKPIEEITLSISEKIKEKLQSFSITKGQPEKSTMGCLNLELSKELFIKSQEGFYIGNYNKIAQSYNLKTEEPFIFYDECEEIIRFGINIHNTQKVAQSFNDTLTNIIKTNEHNIKPLGNKLQNANDKEGKSQSNKSNDQAVLNYDNFKILHPLETLLFKEALGYMLSEKNKSILVDIFERDKSGYIDISDKDKPKTHTVVLCREDFSNNNFLVIDPSNSEFSKHFGLLGVNNILSMELQKEINIFVSPINYKIYEQNKDIGTGCAFNKFRDCVDIAFKLVKKLNLLSDQATHFNNDLKQKGIFIENEMNKIVQSITNNKDYDDSIDKGLCKEKFLNYSFRGKQLTNEELGENLYSKQMILYKSLLNKMDNIIDPNVVTTVNKILNQLLNNPTLDIANLDNLINKINLTIAKQNETKELWNVQITNDNQMDINTDIIKLSGDLNENFENYYNSEL